MLRQAVSTHQAQHNVDCKRFVEIATQVHRCRTNESQQCEWMAPYSQGVDLLSKIPTYLVWANDLATNATWSNSMIPDVGSPRPGSVSANLTVALWSVVGLLLIHFNLLWSCEIQAGFIVPPVKAGLPFIRLQCLIFLYHRHVAQLVRAEDKFEKSHARGSISNVFMQVIFCVVGSSPTVSNPYWHIAQSAVAYAC